MTDTFLLFSQNPGSREKGTLYRSAIFPKAVQLAFFNNNKTLSLAKQFPSYFSDNNGLPLVTIALLTTAVSLFYSRSPSNNANKIISYLGTLCNRRMEDWACARKYQFHGERIQTNLSTNSQGSSRLGRLNNTRHDAGNHIVST